MLVSLTQSATNQNTGQLRFRSREPARAYNGSKFQCKQLLHHTTPSYNNYNKPTNTQKISFVYRDEAITKNYTQQIMAE